MLNIIIENYLKDIHRVHSRGDAREESSIDDIHHCIRVAKALQLTIEMQNKIDNIYPQIEKTILK